MKKAQPPVYLARTVRDQGMLFQCGSGEVCHLLAAGPGVLGVMTRGGLERYALSDGHLIDRESCPGTRAVALEKGVAIAGQSLQLPSGQFDLHQGNLLQLEAVTGGLLASLGEDGQLLVLTSEGAEQRRVPVPQGSDVLALDGLKAWIAGNGKLSLFDLSAGLCLRTLDFTPRRPPQGGTLDAPSITELRWLGQHGLVALTEDGQVHALLEDQWRAWPVEHIAALASQLDADGRLWAVTHDGQALAFDPATGAPMTAIEVSDGLLDVLELESEGHRYLAVASNRQVWLHPHPYGEPGATLRGDEDEPALDVVVCQAFARDGRLLAVGDIDGSLGLIRTENGTLRKSVAGHSDCVTALAFHPRASSLASGSADGTVGLWEVPSLESVHFLDGHDGPITSLAFSPDGALLASGGADGQVVLWDVEQGQAIHALTAFESGVEGVLFSPTGESLSVSEEAGLVTVWDMTRHHR